VEWLGDFDISKIGESGYDTMALIRQEQEDKIK